MSDLPQPGMPKVEQLAPGLQRWSFASDDLVVRRAEFEHWRGWFGLEEHDEPEDAGTATWLVRRQK